MNKIMTISELRSFCKKEKLFSFKAKDEEKEVLVTMDAYARLEEFEEHYEYGLAPFVCFAYHDHVNLNHSSIDPDLFKKKLDTLELKPILAHVVTNPDTGTLDFGGHSMMVMDEGTEFERVKYIEQPVGVISGMKMIVEDEKQGVNRSMVTGYIYETYCPEVVSIIKNMENSTADVSIELSVSDFDYDWDTDLLIIRDYDVNGVTLLGSHQRPGMEGSQLTMFNEDMKKVKIFSEDDDIQKGGTDMEDENKIVLEEESVNEVTPDGGEEPEIETTEEEVVDDTPAEKEPETEEEDFKLESFELYAMLSKLVSDQAKNKGFEAVTVAMTEDKVVWANMETKECYSQKFTEDVGDVSLNAEFERCYPLFMSQKEMDEYTNLSNEVERISSLLTQYQKESEDAKKKTILEDPTYTPMLETAHFAEVIGKQDEMNAEEFKVACELAFAKCVKDNGWNGSKTSTRFNLGKAKTKAKSRYGNLFKEDK